MELKAFDKIAVGVATAEIPKIAINPPNDFPIL